MFNSVLIANRGEIAVRIARTAKRLGLRVIAVYSEADADALHVRIADEAHLIGPPAARESYLSIDKLITVARFTQAPDHGAEGPSSIPVSVRQVDRATVAGRPDLVRSWAPPGGWGSGKRARSGTRTSMAMWQAALA